MKTYDELAAGTMFSEKNGVQKLLTYDQSLTLVGEGRSAVVFRIDSTDLALKVFFPTHEQTAMEEAKNYRKLEGISYYPNLHAAGKNYIVIDFIEGMTIFDCLKHGINISEKHIKMIEEALEQARSCGLNPSDIHLKNIMITNAGEIKLIDVARFQQKKKCNQWDDIMLAYHKFYRKSMFPKKIPACVLNFISYMYKRTATQKWLANFH